MRDGDDEETLHERIKVVERRLLVEHVGRLARDGLDRRADRKVDRSRDATQRRPVPAGRLVVSVYDKTGLVELAAGARTPPASSSSPPARRRRGSPTRACR